METLIPAPATRAESITHARGSAGMMIGLFITGFGAFVNLYAVQPLLPQFRSVFGASELGVSLTISAPVLAVAMLAPFIGLIADTLGRKRIIIAAMIGLSIPTMLAATATNLPQLIFWRFLQGIAVPGIIAVAMAYISEESAQGSVGFMMSTYVTGTIVGGFMGRFGIGMITPVWGWRMAFIVTGAVTLAGAIASWLLLPRSTKFVRHKNINESLGSIRSHLKNRQLLATYAVGFNVLFCLVGAFTYVNFYLTDPPFNFGPAALGSIFAVYLIGAVITPAAGRFLDRFGFGNTLKLAAVVAAAGIMLTLARWTPAVVAGLAMCASGAFGSQLAAASHVGRAARIAKSSAAGLYVGFYYFGGFVGSTMPGLIWKQAGWAGCVAIIAVVQVCIVLIASKFWHD
jgi:YNFM family putative membrane transporter